MMQPVHVHVQAHPPVWIIILPCHKVVLKARIKQLDSWLLGCLSLLQGLSVPQNCICLEPHSTQRPITSMDDPLQAGRHGLSCIQNSQGCYKTRQASLGLARSQFSAGIIMALTACLHAKDLQLH